MARPLVHLAVSLGLAALQLARTRRPLLAAVPLVSGFLVDADHLVDYRMYRASPADSRGRVILPLHGWEYLPLLAWLEARALGGRTAHGLTLGLVAHLALDQLTNELDTPLTYSVLYRAARGFPADVFTGRAGEHRWRETPVWRLWQWL